MLKIETLIEEAHSNAREKGFWDEEQTFATKAMLIVTELAEAVESDRNNNITNLREEIADVFIRMADLCGGDNRLKSIEEAIKAKMERNKERPRLHGKLY